MNHVSDDKSKGKENKKADNREKNVLPLNATSKNIATNNQISTPSKSNSIIEKQSTSATFRAKKSNSLLEKRLQYSREVSEANRSSTSIHIDSITRIGKCAHIF